MRTIVLLIVVAVAALMCGCGSTAPSELTGARAAYERASAGPAANLSPQELHKAQTALEKAEAAFKDDADSYRTRDLAYVAQRKAEMAEASASIATQRLNVTASNEDFNTAQGDILQERTQELRDTRAALTSSEQAVQATVDELAAEQRAHLVTEARMAEQGALMQEKNQDLSQARTTLAVSEAVGQASVDQLAAEQSARLETERRAAARDAANQGRTPIVIQDRTPIVIQTPAAATPVAPAVQPVTPPAATPVVQPVVPPAAAPVAQVTAPAAAPVAQPTTEQLVATEVARLEAARMSAEQARRLESSTSDLNQTRTALAVSEYAGQSSAAQLEAAQRARLDAENKSTDQDRRLQQNAQDLNRAQTALAASEQAGQATADQLAVEQKDRLAAEETAADRLAAEQKARLAAEQATAETRAELDALIATKDDRRGEVFTLSGGVLFRSNESSLMPGAESQLQRLVKALATTADRNIVVEGYTDSQGSDDHNLDLSQRRADTVRSYLVRSGYPAGRILAEGIGEERPIADNSTSEGRASNRRVEIVLGPAPTP
ncbi:MAG: OmpA family protein [bacterium]|nr:OmpA family protein [bacterium]